MARETEIAEQPAQPHQDFLVVGAETLHPEKIADRGNGIVE